MAATGLQVTATSRVGIDKDTGQVLQGWPHCSQSLWTIFTTRVNTRIMRLDFGSEVPNLIDRPSNKATFAMFFVALTQAIYDWEPGFRVSQFSVVGANADGQVTIEVGGVYYPRGHLGDYSIAENVTMSFVTAALSGLATGTL